MLSSLDSDNPSFSGVEMPAVAKKEHLPHPVTKQWRADVRAELDKRGRGAQARLREYIVKCGIKISSGHLSDILDGKYETSDIVGPVHEFFKWPPPMPPTTSRDAGELLHVFSRLTPEQRAALEAGRDRIGEMSGDEARKLLAMLFPPKT